MPNNRLHARPGYLIRRLHQIHIALFSEECDRFGVTPVQYSVMTVLLDEPGLDQATVAQRVGIDRANATDVLARLERKRLLARRADAGDARYKRCFLTASGRALVSRMRPAIARAHARTVAPLPARERPRLMRMLRRLVDAAG
jgi:DNA-binding MarR family transcriptional regulator